MTSLCLAALTVGLVAGAQDASAISIAAPGLATVNLESGLDRFYTEHVAQALTRNGIRVSTASDISAVLGVERQRELLGCTDNQAACITEIANALGVDGVLIGEIGKFSGFHQVNLKVVSSRNGQVLALATARPENDRALLDALDTAARSLAEQLSRATGKAVTLAPLPAESSVTASAGADGADVGAPRFIRFVPGAVGLALVGAGGFFLSDAARHRDALRAERQTLLTAAEARAHADDGSRSQTLGWSAAGLGVAGIAASAVWLLSSPAQDTPAAVSLLPSREGAHLTISGAFE